MQTEIAVSGERPAPRRRCCAPVPTTRLDTMAAKDFARLFRALADETRVRIVDLLTRSEGEICVCDIVSQFDLGQPTISHHLGVLRRAGLVRAAKRGLWVYYRVNRERLRHVAAFAQR